MRSNPYVYPFVPFNNLSEKNIGEISDQKTVSTKEIKQILEATDDLRGRAVESWRGTDTIDTILNVFKDPEVRFGPEEYIVDYQDQLREQFNTFVKSNTPIHFTILGFPFKIPVPLKTNREKPDFGELAALKRLHTLGKIVEDVYQSGARITIFSEGAFASAVGVDPEVAEMYHKYLGDLIRTFELDDVLEIRKLKEMEKEAENFEELYDQKIEELKTKYNEGDEEYLAKYQGSYPSVYRIVSTQNYEISTLMEVYNEDLTEEQVDGNVREIRTELETRTHEAIFRYHAYLALRDDLNFLEKVTPGAVRLSVSPKPGRLGVHPLHSQCDKLPYHSVSVYNPHHEWFTQEYLIDILRDTTNSYTKVFWKEDSEDKPFYYEQTDVRND